MKPADPERHSPWAHDPLVRALAGLVALALLSAPAAGVLGLLLESTGSSRDVYEVFYMWFWWTALAVFLGSLAGVALWLIVRLSAIALGTQDDSPCHSPSGANSTSTVTRSPARSTISAPR